ncbi:hypothetical protein BB561_006846, partial [Smittium simulii]
MSSLNKRNRRNKKQREKFQTEKINLHQSKSSSIFTLDYILSALRLQLSYFLKIYNSLKIFLENNSSHILSQSPKFIRPNYYLNSLKLMCLNIFLLLQNLFFKKTSSADSTSIIQQDSPSSNILASKSSSPALPLLEVFDSFSQDPNLQFHSNLSSNIHLNH